MTKVLTKLMALLSVMLLATVTLQAQGATLTIEPASGDPGTSFTITVQGLQANTTYTTDFILQSSGETLFTTDRTSNNTGELVLNISSSDSDPEGVYLVQVSERDTVIVEGQFTLGAGRTPAQPQPTAQPPAGDSRVTLRVVPESAETGAIFDIVASGLEGEQIVSLRITDPSGTEVYNRSQTADAGGQLGVEIFTTEADTAGTYTVSLLDTAGVLLAGGSFEVTSPAGRDASVTVSPPQGAATATYSITVVDLKPFADILIEVNSTTTGDTIFSRRIRADVNGVVAIEFAGDESLDSGAYEVIVQDGDVRVADGTLTIEDGVAPVPAAGDATISISPTTGEAGTSYDVSITGLSPNASFTFEVSFEGEAVYTVERTADADGSFSTTLNTDNEDASGDYRVVARDNDAVLVEGTLTITGDDVVVEPEVNESGVNIRVNPASAEPRTLRLVTVTGLEAGSSVILRLVRDGEQLERFNKTADINGTVVLSIPAVGDETPGTYTLTIVTYGDQDTILAEADVIVEGDDATQPEVVQPTPVPLSISVNPPSGDVGTSHTITVEGLDASETVTLNISVNGTSVYSVQRSANGEGMLVHNVRSEEGDPAGTYEVSILRDGVVVLSDNFEVTGATTVQPPATQTPAPETGYTGIITIDPVSAAAGNIHEITVTALTPGETVLVDVMFGGASVYSTEKVADDSGIVSLFLATDVSDAPGDYTVRILRDGTALTEAMLTVLADTPPPVVEGDVQIVIDPAAGAIGTSHAVTVSGLNPGETVTLNVVFAGLVEFTTERVADDSGMVTINLIADEGDPTGVYTVEIVRADGAVAAADFNVEAADTVVTPPQQPAGDDTVVSETLNDVSTTYTFSGDEGDIIQLMLSSDEFDAYMILQDNTGFELTFDDDSAGELNAAIGPFVLPYTGEYTVVISSYGGITNGELITGEYTLTISDVVITPIVVGQTQSLGFSPDSDNFVLSFEAQVGDILDVTVTGDQAVDTVLKLTDPNGNVVLEDDDGGEGYNPEVQAYTVLMPGTYLMELRSFNDGTSGNVSVLLEQRQALQLSAAPQQVTVTGKQPVNVVTVEVTAGQRVLVNITQVDGNSSVTIEAVQNDITLMSYTGQAIPDGTRPGFIAPESGVVSILISGDYVGNATIELSVEQ